MKNNFFFFRFLSRNLIIEMDSVYRQDDISLPQVLLYGSISFLIVSLLGVLLYISCSKKYKLNWFEKNLLENANGTEELGHR